MNEEIKPKRGGWKLSEETKKKISEANKRSGKKPPSALGRKLSEETKRKIGLANSVSLLGLKHSKEYKKNMSNILKGKPKSKEHALNISKAKRGANSNLWKGGRSSLQQILRHSFQYRQWRSDVYTRDDYTCQECGIKGGTLNADHVKSFASILDEYNIKTLEEALFCEELWNINNGRTLCVPCHRKTDTYGNGSHKLK